MLKKAILVAALTLTGCANQETKRPQSLGLPLAGTMDVELRLTQREIIILTAHSSAGAAAGMQAAGSPAVAAGGFAAGAAAGLIGALIDTAIDKHQTSVAEENVKPLRAHMVDTHPYELVLASFDGMDKAHLAQAVEVKVIDHSEADDLDKKTLQPESNVLVLTPTYFIGYGNDIFVYVLDARLVDRAHSYNGPIGSTPRYHTTFRYVFKPGDLPGGAKWADLDANQWKALLTDASEETIAMLNYDLAQIGSATPANGTRMPSRHTCALGARSWLRVPAGLSSVAEADGAQGGNTKATQP